MLCRPDIKISCDVPYDPFKYMREHKKIYGAYDRILYTAIMLKANRFYHGIARVPNHHPEPLVNCARVHDIAS